MTPQDQALQSTYHWAYVAAMALGALLFASWWRNPKNVPREEYLIATIIPVWSGLAYTAMAFNYGKIEIDGQITHIPRYIDWVVTTPLLLLALALTGMKGVKKDVTTIAGVMAADVIMIVCGLVADLTSGTARYTFYAAGVGAFLVVLGVIWGKMRRIAHENNAEIASIYDKLTAYLTVLWIGYPVVWILGPSGLGVFGQNTDTLLYCVLPFFSKVGFSFLDLKWLRDLSDRSPHHLEEPEPVMQRDRRGYAS